MPRPFPVDEGAVGGDHGPHAVGHGPRHQFREVRPHQGFAAGKQHDRHAEILQVGKQSQAFGVAQFIRRRARGGLGVAVEALEIALFGDVPDHHRLFVRRKLEEMGRQVLGPAVPVTQHISGFHGAAIEFRNSDHRAYSLNRVVW